MFRNIPEKVIEMKKNSLLTLIDEEKSYGSYQKWYESLSDFRKALKKKYIIFRTPWGTMRYRDGRMANGHIVDHHIMAYFAPMKFKRPGWGGIPRLPMNKSGDLHSGSKIVA